MESPGTNTRDLAATQYPCVILLIATSIGIIADRCFDLHWTLIWAVLVVSIVFWCIAFTLREYRLASFALLLSVIGFGAGWHHVWWNWYPSDEIGLVADDQPQPVVIEVLAATEPRRAPPQAANALNALPSEPRTIIRAQAQRVRDGMRWREVSGKLEIYVHGVWSEGRAGDQLRIVGQLAAVAGPRNPGEFDFRNHFRGQRRQAVVYADMPDAIRIIDRDDFWPTTLRSALRRKLDEVVWARVAPENAGLASAVLLGNRQQLTAEQQDRFMLSSTIHVLSISGLHVGILAAMLFWVMRFGLVSRRVCLLTVLVLVLFYAWLVEFNSPVTRAAILISLYCASRLMGRTGYSMNLLACAGMIVLGANPTELFGVGPQLSFLAVVSMIGAARANFRPTDPLDRLIFATRPRVVRISVSGWRHVREAIRISAVIWLIALPIVAARFHIVSPIGLLVNPLILVPMALAMYFGMGVLLTGWWFPWLADLMGAGCHACLNCMVDLVNWSTEIPGGHFWTPSPPVISIGLFYCGVIVAYLLPNWRAPSRWLFALFAGWTAIGWALPQAIWRGGLRHPQSMCEMTFVDVGHGLSVLIHLPNGQHLVYDAGSFSSSAFGLRSVSSVLWDRGIEHLDGIVISHADIDHFNAIPELCNRFSIGAVYMSRPMYDDDSDAVRALKRALFERRVPIKQVHRGMRLAAGNDCSIECLVPSYYETGKSDNSNSVVLSISAFGRHALLTGDVEGVGLESLLFSRLEAPVQPETVPYDVVLAPHHGSVGSLPAEFVRWSRPAIVVISGSRQKTDSQLIAMFEQPDGRVVTTASNGAVAIRLNENEIRCRTWREHGGAMFRRP